MQHVVIQIQICNNKTKKECCANYYPKSKAPAEYKVKSYYHIFCSYPEEASRRH